MKKQGGRSRAVMLQESKTWWLRYRGSVVGKILRREAVKDPLREYPVGLRRAAEISGGEIPEKVGSPVRLTRRGVNHRTKHGKNETLCGLPVLNAMDPGERRMCVGCGIVVNSIGLNVTRLFQQEA